MKKSLLVIVLILLSVVLVQGSYATQTSITLDSHINSGGDYYFGISNFYKAGTYEFSVESGSWNPWYGSAGVTGCSSNGTNCTTGWMWSMDIFQPSTSTYFRLGNKIDKYSTASLALSAHLGEVLTFEQPSDGDLWFFVKDGSLGGGNEYVRDNLGTVTASVSLTSSPTVNGPVAPEPVSSLLFVTGATLLAGRRYLKKRKSA